MENNNVITPEASRHAATLATDAARKLKAYQKAEYEKELETFRANVDKHLKAMYAGQKNGGIVFNTEADTMPKVEDPTEDFPEGVQDMNKLSKLMAVAVTKKALKAKDRDNLEAFGASVTSSVKHTSSWVLNR